MFRRKAVNGCPLQRLFQYFRVFWAFICKTISLFLAYFDNIKQLTEFGICLLVLIFSRPYLSVVQLNWFIFDRSSDLIVLKSYLSFFVRLSRNTLLPSFVCFKLINSSKEFTTWFLTRVCNSSLVDGRSNIWISHYVF